jgi:hypothetical protein
VYDSQEFMTDSVKKYSKVEEEKMKLMSNSKLSKVAAGQNTEKKNNGGLIDCDLSPAIEIDMNYGKASMSVQRMR